MGTIAISIVAIAISTPCIAAHIKSQTGISDNDKSKQQNQRGNEKSENEILFDREDYFKDLDRRDKERLFTETRLGNDLGGFMKLLISFLSLGIGGILYKSGINDVTVVCLICLILSLLFTVLAYAFSLWGLAKWSEELTHIDIKYEDMNQPSNLWQHLLIAFSVLSLFVAIIYPIYIFYAK